MTPMAPPPDWIAVDWGTSRLRAWAMGADGRPLAGAESGEGMGRLAPDGFEPALLRLAGPWLPAARGPVPVMACGMVGSRQGWVEAPYRAVPCAPLGAGFARAPAQDARLAVHVVPGLRQDRPPDVMRGEETQIAGVLAGDTGFDGVVCLPGTHTKWAHLSAGEVVSFTSCMTGELFDLLSRVSVLRHTLGGGWEDAAFAEGVGETLARPERLMTQLFALRAASLLGRLAPDAARARLSGLLIGAELAATRPWWLGRRVVVVGAEALSAIYLRALGLQGVAAERRDGRAMTLAGLAAARAMLAEGVA